MSEQTDLDAWYAGFDKTVNRMDSWQEMEVPLHYELTRAYSKGVLAGKQYLKEKQLEQLIKGKTNDT